MKTSSSLAVLSFLALTLAPQLTHAECTTETAVGVSCSHLGESCMTPGGDAILACLAETSGSSSYVWKTMSSGGGSTPSGGIMAFNTSSDTDCPDGWTAVTSLVGHVIVGTGTVSDSFGTATYKTGIAGGERKHTLITDEMPSHTHRSPNGNMILTLGGGDVYHNISPYQPTWNAGYVSELAYTGGNQPHNIMQPYVPFLYCQKN